MLFILGGSGALVFFVAILAVQFFARSVFVSQAPHLVLSRDEVKGCLAYFIILPVYSALAAYAK